MSIFATVAIVCTMSACNDYIVDHSTTRDEAVINAGNHAAGVLSAMETEQGMNSLLENYRIGETVFEIVSIDIETKEIQPEDLP